MAMAVLRSHDCLKNRHHLDAYGFRRPPPAKPHRKKSPPPAHSSPPTHPPPPAPPRKAFKPSCSANHPPDGLRSPSPLKDGAQSDGETCQRRALVMEEVRIMKRGEELKPRASLAADQSLEGDDSALRTSNQLGPEPEILPRKVGLAVLESAYAGPAFLASPSPSSLPIPSFFLKKAVSRATRP
ncbi:alginate regulatory protein AlgP [Musa troglodytarum]|uniref:Alginate regulatory protein AlgP n=1 Tax=Musa troglodytarum TaxID=320322 RepID=A0A9E7KLQ4_9LILI|nr:alginate regulatory protein AlgP [Musa troglodytarum]